MREQTKSKEVREKLNASCREDAAVRRMEEKVG